MINQESLINIGLFVVSLLSSTKQLANYLQFLFLLLFTVHLITVLTAAWDGRHLVIYLFFYLFFFLAIKVQYDAPLRGAVGKTLFTHKHTFNCIVFFADDELGDEPMQTSGGSSLLCSRQQYVIQFLYFFDGCIHPSQPTTITYTSLQASFCKIVVVVIAVVQL